MPKISFEEFVDGKSGDLTPPPPTLREHLDALEAFELSCALQLSRANELLFLLRAKSSHVSPESEVREPRPSGFMNGLAVATRNINTIHSDLELVLDRLAHTLGAPDGVGMRVVPTPPAPPQSFDARGFKSL